MNQHHLNAQAAELMADASKHGIIYRAIRAAAIDRKPCPTNKELALSIGCSSTGLASAIVSELEDDSALAIVRGARARKVTIRAIGMATWVPENMKVIPRSSWALRGPKIAAANCMGNLANDRRHKSERGAIFRPRAVLEHGKPVAVAIAPAEHDDARPAALTREPCPKCGTRGDLGCTHFSPFKPETTT